MTDTPCSFYNIHGYSWKMRKISIPPCALGFTEDGAVHKRCRNFLGHFWYPPPPCRNFKPNLPNPYLLISCNIEIWDPLKYSNVFYRRPPVARTKGFSEIRLQQLPMPAPQVFQTEIRYFFFFRVWDLISMSKLMHSQDSSCILPQLSVM